MTSEENIEVLEKSRYESGAELNVTVYRHGNWFVRWTLPDGGEVLTTLTEYNNKFPVEWKKDYDRTISNRKKREKIGLD